MRCLQCRPVCKQQWYFCGLKAQNAFGVWYTMIIYIAAKTCNTLIKLCASTPPIANELTQRIASNKGRYRLGNKTTQIIQKQVKPFGWTNCTSQQQYSFLVSIDPIWGIVTTFKNMRQQCSGFTMQQQRRIQFIRTMMKIRFPICLRIRLFTFSLLSLSTSWKISEVLPSSHWFRNDLIQRMV